MIEECGISCNGCAIGSPLHRMAYKIFMEIQKEHNINIYPIIQRNCPNLTCCPHCHIDDFCHISHEDPKDNCEFYKE